MKKRVAIIGAGVSGLTCAQLLKDDYDVTVYEKEATPGGLIRCRSVGGSLFHTCGGHIFNSKRQDVLDWFWSHFDKDLEFVKADRNSVVVMENEQIIPYPIENHAYLFPEDIQKRIVDDLVLMFKEEDYIPTNFSEFLRHRFGETLYNLYFEPYNKKVWRRDLSQVPLSWLEGKLPMPTVAEIIYNNMNHVKEKAFVHSSFWYENQGGSQFIANRLSDGLNIIYGVLVDSISYVDLSKKWLVMGEEYDHVIYCGNLKDMVLTLQNVDLSDYIGPVGALEYHGTTSVFCEIDRNPYSWIYQPSRKHESHRIICTGNFSSANNGGVISSDRITATVEFTDEISKEKILKNLQEIPLHPTYLDHQYNQYTYPIQNEDTRVLIKTMKSMLSSNGFYFTGRFADWEYYNMDAAIGAAMDTIQTYFHVKS